MGTFFEQFGKKVTQTSQDAMKKTKEFAEIAKLNTQISDEEKRLNKIYMNLGRLYYQLYGNQPSLEFKDLCLAIEGSLKNVEHYEVMVNELRGIKRCESCGTEMPIDSTFCQTCGSRLNEERGSVVAVVCAKSGMENVAQATSCIGCGQPL